MNEGFKAWLIPDDKRKEAIEIIDNLLEAIGNNRASDLGYNYYSDPIMKFQDISVLSEQNQKYLIFQMKKINAKDVTEIFIDEL